MTASDERQSDVRAAFGDWARPLPGAPRDAASLVREVSVAHEHLGMLATDVEGRRVVWRTVPASPRARLTWPELSLEAVDPWTADASQLRARSDHVAVCGDCGGEKKAACAACAGSGKILCTACGGQRKMYGYAADGSRRLLNCTTCRGKGEVDCAQCRRGIAACAACAGQGRVQLWMELERWRRSVTTAHPDELLRRCAWGPNPSNTAIARDADLMLDVDRPHPLSPADLGATPATWLHALAAPLQPGERVARQRLRIVRLSLHTAHYRIGAREDRAVFTGHRLVPPPAASAATFEERGWRLRACALVLLALAALFTLVSLGRGAFYWSIPTLLSLFAFGGSLGAMYGAVCDWTGARRHVRHWLTAAAACLAIGLLCMAAALPRQRHAESLIARGRLEAAESELLALGATVPVQTWADLRLARVRNASEIEAARNALQQIPRELPQYGEAVAAADRLFLQKVAAAAAARQWTRAAEALSLLSAGGRSSPRAAGYATDVYVALARRKLDARDWSGAADALGSARAFGVPAAALDEPTGVIREAALDAIAASKRERDALRRLRQRIEAEALVVAWERATGQWGTSTLIDLRTAMARDVAAAEKAARRRR